MAEEKGGKSASDHVKSVWDFESPEQEKKMMEPITKENCGKKLKLIREVTGISRRGLADSLGVSESTKSRLETGTRTEATDAFMEKLLGLVAIGYATYSKMTEKDKEKLSEYIGVSGGVVAGVGGAIGAISASGTVAGLSAAGMTSGLAAIGGGTMLGGLVAVAIIPVAAGVAGFGLVKGIKAICKVKFNKLSCKEVNERWEIRKKGSRTDNTEENTGEKQ